MKVWMTKWALTKGIWSSEVEDSKVEYSAVRDNGMLECKDWYKGDEKMDLIWGYFHGEGKDWHKSEESAKRRAREMRDKKIKSLEKQIKKLRGMEF